MDRKAQQARRPDPLGTAMWVALVCVASPVAAHGQATSDHGSASIETVLDWHADAHGFSRTTAMTSALFIRATVEAFGMEGELTAWTEAPLRRWTRLELGAMTLESGFDGETGWIRDRNGAVRATAGAEHTGMLLDALVHSGEYVLRQPPVGVKRRLMEVDGNPETLELVVEPADGDAEVLVIDRGTMRRVGTLWDTGSATEQTRFHSWQWVDGVLVPESFTVSMAENADLHFRVVEARHTPPRGKAAYQLPRDVPQTVVFHRGADSGWIPMLGQGDHILLYGVVNENREGAFLLDTGASGNVLESSLVDELGLVATGQVDATGVAGTATARFVDVEHVEVGGKLGGLTLVQQNWLSLDFSQIEPLLGHDVLGVLGYDLLSRTVLEVDYLTREVRFRSPDSFEPRKGAVPVKLRLDQNVPTVAISINGHEGWVHVDTGSNNTLDLAGAFTRQHDLLATQDTLRDSGLVGLGGERSSLRGTLDRVELGGFEFHELPAYFHDTDEGVFASRTLAGVMGAGVLRQFHCAFDYSQQTLWLSPTMRYVPPYPTTLSGIVLRRVDGQFEVYDVTIGSPAARAGVRPGDHIIGLNDDSLTAEDLRKLRGALDGEAAPRVSLQIKREGKNLRRSFRIGRG